MILNLCFLCSVKYIKACKLLTLPLGNTFPPHKASRTWCCRSLINVHQDGSEIFVPLIVPWKHSNGSVVNKTSNSLHGFSGGSPNYGCLKSFTITVNQCEPEGGIKKGVTIKSAIGFHIWLLAVEGGRQGVEKEKLLTSSCRCSNVRTQKSNKED